MNKFLEITLLIMGISCVLYALYGGINGEWIDAARGIIIGAGIIAGLKFSTQ